MTNKVKNAAKIAELSKLVTPFNKMPLYYNMNTKTVYNKPGKDRSFITNLINPNTEEDIIDTVNRWLWM